MLTHAPRAYPCTQRVRHPGAASSPHPNQHTIPATCIEHPCCSFSARERSCPFSSSFPRVVSVRATLPTRAGVQQMGDHHLRHVTLGVVYGPKVYAVHFPEKVLHEKERRDNIRALDES